MVSSTLSSNTSLISSSVSHSLEALVHLPNEVWENICNHFSSQKDLKSLNLVNRRFNRIVQGILWHEPSLRPFDVDQFEYLCRMPIRVLKVPLMSFRIPLPNFDTVDVVFPKLFKLIGSMISLSELSIDISQFLNFNNLVVLALLPSLESLTFHGDSFLQVVPEFAREMAHLLSRSSISKLHLKFPLIKMQQHVLPLMFGSDKIQLKELTLVFGELGGYEESLAVLSKLEQLRCLHIMLFAYFEDWELHQEFMDYCKKFEKDHPCVVKIENFWDYFYLV